MKKIAFAMLLAALENLLKNLALDAQEKGSILSLLDNARAEIDADHDGVPDALEARLSQIESRLTRLDPEWAGAADVPASTFTDVFAGGAGDVNVDASQAPRGGVVNVNEG